MYILDWIILVGIVASIGSLIFFRSHRFQRWLSIMLLGVFIFLFIGFHFFD